MILLVFRRMCILPLRRQRERMTSSVWQPLGHLRQQPTEQHLGQLQVVVVGWKAELYHQTVHHCHTHSEREEKCF